MPAQHRTLSPDTQQSQHKLAFHYLEAQNINKHWTDLYSARLAAKGPSLQRSAPPMPKDTGVSSMVKTSVDMVSATLARLRRQLARSHSNLNLHDTPWRIASMPLCPEYNTHQPTNGRQTHHLVLPQRWKSRPGTCGRSEQPHQHSWQASQLAAYARILGNTNLTSMISTCSSTDPSPSSCCKHICIPGSYTRSR
jgi:hypothetical protein